MKTNYFKKKDWLGGKFDLLHEYECCEYIFSIKLSLTLKKNLDLSYSLSNGHKKADEKTQIEKVP